MRHSECDAHLKNLALVYDDVDQVPRLAPVCDLVTTAAYLPADRMALTLNGTPAWPEARRERVADAVAATTVVMQEYAATHPDFAEIGARMAAIWSEGTLTSLVGKSARNVRAGRAT